MNIFHHNILTRDLDFYKFLVQNRNTMIDVEEAINIYTASWNARMDGGKLELTECAYITYVTCVHVYKRDQLIIPNKPWDS